MRTFLKYFIAFITLFCLGWVPLISAYDYEASVCVALTGLIFIPILSPESPKESRLGLFKTIGSIILFWIIANIAILFVTLLRDELCSFKNGLFYQLLISLPSNLLAGLFWGWIARMTHRKWIRIPVYLFILCLDFGFAIYALYNWPPIISFGQFYGYFAGSIYDESIDIFKSLEFYRIGTSLLILCLILAQTSKAHLARRIILPFAGIILAASYHLFLVYTDVLPPIGREKIQMTLWQTVSSKDKSFTVHFLPKSKNRQDLNAEKARIFKDFNNDYQYLSDFFKTTPPQPIDIWLYPDAKLKGKFIGAERTSFARVWKNETHLVETTPDSTLARHEMAHLFAASFGNTPLGLAGGHHIPVMGWIEGFAMAAEWPIKTYNLHTWSQAILDNPSTFGEITPHKLLYGFWGMPSRVAYTLAGSYVRYLIEQYGLDKIKQLSNLMPADYEEILGRDFNTVFEDWKKWLNRYYKNEKAIILAPVVYSSSSIFNKHCARNHARLNADYIHCLTDNFCSIQELGEMTASFQELCTHNESCDNSRPDPQMIEQYYRLYMILGPLDNQRPISLALLLMNRYMDQMFSYGLNKYYQYKMNTTPIPDNPVDMNTEQLRDLIFSQLLPDRLLELPPAARLVWLERSADMLWHSGLNYPAALMYYAMYRMVLPEDMARRIEIKLQASGHPQNPVSEQILIWFTTNRPSDLLSIPDKYPEVQILSYLDFIASINRRDFDRAWKAWARIILYLYETDPVRRMPPKAWSELFRMIVYID